MKLEKVIDVGLRLMWLTENSQHYEQIATKMPVYGKAIVPLYRYKNGLITCFGVGGLPERDTKTVHAYRGMSLRLVLV